VSKSADFPYTARQQRWWFATHGAEGVLTVSDYEKGARPHPLLFNGQRSASGEVVVRQEKDGTFAVFNRVNGTDVPHATSADAATAADMAGRLFGRSLHDDMGALIYGHRQIALGIIASGGRPSESMLAEHPDLRGMTKSVAASKLKTEKKRFWKQME
jgi:hypothetical protein